MLKNNLTALAKLFAAASATPKPAVLYTSMPSELPPPASSTADVVDRVIFGKLLPSTTTTSASTFRPTPADIFFEHDVREGPPDNSNADVSGTDTDNILLREEKCWLNLAPAAYEPVTAALCASLVVLGVIYILYGYRCFKSIMFLTGFLFATTLVYLICCEEELMPMYGNIAVALTAGFLFGLITMLVGYALVT